MRNQFIFHHVALETTRVLLSLIHNLYGSTRVHEVYTIKKYNIKVNNRVKVNIYYIGINVHNLSKPIMPRITQNSYHI